jgi:hypothetical protein
LGVFNIDSAANPVYDEEKQQYDSPIHFTPDSKATDDPELINFIVEISSKIRPLAIADLESYVAAGKQLLNISKPFMIEGLGALNRNAQGHIEFLPGSGGAHVTEEVNRPIRQRASADSSEAISFHDNYLKPPKSGDNIMQKLLIAAACLVGIAIIAWVVYFFLYREESHPLEQPPIVITQPAVSTPDTTTKIQQAPIDSVKLKQDSIVTTKPASTTTATSGSTSPTYNIVIEYANKARALKRFAVVQQWESGVKLATKDSVYFKLYCTFTGPLSDTTHKKDSLSSYYGRKVYVELNP